MPEPERKPQIAILGGGIGGLATAWHLTNDPAVRRQYDITIYQLGWRLGGKCASSRNADARHRIEEHGIHIFGGFYYNALDMLWDCYRELGLDFEKAFLPIDYLQMWAFRNRKWKLWHIAMAPNKRVPWRKKPVRDHFDELPGPREWLGAAIDVVASQIPLPTIVARLLLKLARHDLTRPSGGRPFWVGPRGARPYWRATNFVFGFFEMLLQWPARLSDSMRKQFVQVDYVRAFINGVIKDRLIEDGFDKIDCENFSKWLKRHGARETTLSSPLTVAAANTLFAYDDGDSTRPPEMSAASYANWTLRQFAYLGSVGYKFAAGTGEILIAPLYDALRKRGVKFEFFHKVTGLELDGDRVGQVRFELQAAVLEGSEYEPLKIGSDGLLYWPNRPDYEQLQHGASLESSDVNLESYWADWSRASGYTRALRDSLGQARDGAAPSGNGTLPGKTLRLEPQDRVVLAISLGALRGICPQLIAADSRWGAMLKHLPAIQTQAVQIWLSQCAEHLGWNVGRRRDRLMLGASYLNPMSCQADFSELIEREDWARGDQPRMLVYFCGPLAQDGELPPAADSGYPERQRARVEWQGIQYLQTATGPLLPKATGEAQAKIAADKARIHGDELITVPAADPVGLDFQLLACHDRATAGEGGARFRQQYVRANIDPSELYVTSPPGSAQYRLEASGSGFSNLTLAGDWIYTGLNCGSVEGATMSGMLAANHIAGTPAIANIVGYSPPKNRTSSPQAHSTA